MKRSITALTLCSSILLLLSLFLYPPVEAKENVLLKLLNLPAQPPPNPLVPTPSARYPQDSRIGSPPKDDAPLSELLDYWRQQNDRFQRLRYQPEMSSATRARLLKAIESDPKSVVGYLNVLAGDPKAADLVKEIYDRDALGSMFSDGTKSNLKRWLTYNSPHFSGQLARLASRVTDDDEYVRYQEDLLALARVDFDKAQVIIDRLLGDSSLKASRVLAKWALYRHAVDTDSASDIERYRDELKQVVEDKTATPGMRDLAMDALVAEKDWEGRDEWYYSLLTDESLVKMERYTGLTTLILISPEEKYVEKMLELINSGNPLVRGMAVRNLLVRIDKGSPEIVKALLPWIDDRDWADGDNISRERLVRKLSEYEIPESVPGLIKILDEPEIEAAATKTGGVVNRAPKAVPAVNAMRKSERNGVEEITYPYRFVAVDALAKQKDPRAVPALRRILPVAEIYRRPSVVAALLACNGFTVTEQIEALDAGVSQASASLEAYEAAEAAKREGTFVADPMPSDRDDEVARPFTQADLNLILGGVLLGSKEISDELARAIVARIRSLDKENPKLGQSYRRMLTRWQNEAINVLLMSDVKIGSATVLTVVKLLGDRDQLREKQSGDIYDLRSGSQSAVGIAACLFNDENEYLTILGTGSDEAKTAVLACARLIRARIPVQRVAENLTSKNELLVIAAERYLESEDSIEARSIVLQRHPNEGRIMGSTTAFFPDGVNATDNDYYMGLYADRGAKMLNDGLYGYGSKLDAKLAEDDKQLREEVKKDADLLGVYAYDGNYIRIYRDRIILSWNEDENRYRERPLSKDEFDEIRSYLTTNRVDELPPFLACYRGDSCANKRLLMLGLAGGRRVYMTGEPGEFFSGLDAYFARLKKSDGKLKYALSREIPGLEILFAADDLHAHTVWSSSGDIRIAAYDVAAQKKITDQIRKFYGAPYDDESEVDELQPSTEESWEARNARLVALIEKQESAGLQWYTANGTIAVQPNDVELLLPVDKLAIQPKVGRWRSRTGDMELRASNEGLDKVENGKLTRILSGPYSNPIVTANGRWAAAYKGVGYQGSLVRIDLRTRKEYQVEFDDFRRELTAYVPTLDKFLMVANDYYGRIENETPEARATRLMLLMDPSTGAMQPIAGEFRPLGQQTFRPLQKTSKPNEFWAAIPGKDSTEVGIYDAKLFAFKPVMRIPKITFDSMAMWVDESAGKVYFVYKGHALSLPMPK